MNNDKRRCEKPVPDDLVEILNSEQMLGLRQIERYGWTLAFVRRPLFQEPVAVVFSPEGESIGVLEEDGRINVDTDIEVRDLPAWVRLRQK